MAFHSPVDIKLSRAEIGSLSQGVAGNGIRRDLLRKLQRQFKRRTGLVTLTPQDLRLIPLCAGWSQDHDNIQAILTRVFKRSLKVGKRIGSNVYIHTDAIDAGLSNLSERQLRVYNRALEILRGQARRFIFQFVHICGNKVRFLQMSSLCEPHPHVIVSRNIDVQEETCAAGDGGQIYHRLDRIISPCDSTYEFHLAVSQFEEERGLIGEGISMNKLTWPENWQQWVESEIGSERYRWVIRRLRRKYLEKMLPEDIDQVNRTAPVKRGVVGGRAVVVKYVARTARRGQSVLNFGCGGTDGRGRIPHAVRLEKAGLVVTNYDVGTHAAHADADALERQYDVVMASNVLNVQPNWASLARTLAGIASATKPDGKAVMNYPRKPRRWIQASEDQIKTTVGFYFRNVQVAPVNSEGPIFEATCPHQ